MKDKLETKHGDNHTELKTAKCVLYETKTNTSNNYYTNFACHTHTHRHFCEMILL